MSQGVECYSCLPKTAWPPTLNLVIGDAYYVGSINDDIPSSPANEVTWINLLNNLTAGTGPFACDTEICSRVGSTLAGSLPDITAGYYSLKNETTPEDGWGALYTSFYILGKYDQDQAGALVWYVTGASFGNTYFVPDTFNGHGLSHLSVYSNGTPVPEPGTMMLLGSGLVGLAGWGRKKFRK